MPSPVTIRGEADLHALADGLRRRAGIARPYLVGLAGIPGSGKTTLAARLAAALGDGRPGQAILAPMDGFHLPDEELVRRGLRELKGTPPTFDVAGYAALLRAAREVGRRGPPVRVPIYDRALHRVTRPDGPAHLVTSATRFVVAEGNYLLLGEPPWPACAAALHECWYLDTPREQARQWILARHLAGGRTADQARAHWDQVDLPNALLVERSRERADLIVRWGRRHS